jgi:PAS domain-containing protein
MGTILKPKTTIPPMGPKPAVSPAADASERGCLAGWPGRHLGDCLRPEAAERLKAGNTGKAEEALRKSEERLQIMVRATNDLLWDFDFTTGVLWWSPGYYEKLGLREGTPLTMDLWLYLAVVIRSNTSSSGPAISALFRTSVSRKR